MARRAFAIDTESEAKDFDPPEDCHKSTSRGPQMNYLHQTTKILLQSDLGQECRRHQRIPWQLVNKWDPAEHDADFIMQSITNHADEYMQESGLAFLARQEKKPTHL